MDSEDDEQQKINNILNKIEATVKSGNLETFQDVIQDIHNVQDKALLNSCYNDRGIDLISLICQHSNKKLLKYLLHRSNILHYLISNNKSTELEYKETALYFAMRSNNFEILEMLYDYWIGDLHWLGHKKEYKEFDVDNLNQLHDLLRNAFNKYEVIIKKKEKLDGSMLLNIQSLMAFNDFQRDIYKKLNTMKTTLVTWEDKQKHIVRKKETFVIRSMIIAIIDMYEKYSKKEFCEEINENYTQCSDNKNLDDCADQMPDVEGEYSAIEQMYLYASREVYYRKLDFNVCLLILDHLYLLKLRLSMPPDSYQKLENKLYHFYYHVTNNWRMYLPKKKKIKSSSTLAKYKDILCHYKLDYDSNKWEHSIKIMYYERTDFMKTINTFKKELNDRCIDDNVRQEKCKLSDDEHNYLMLVPELRDDYSLKMMSRLIGQLYSVDINTEHAVLLIERVLQVVGEFLKSTNESLHLEPSTVALLKAEMSVEVTNDLNKLRNMLCHAKKGFLLKRIELEKDNYNILKTIRKELLEVKIKIDKVIKIHKPLVQKALLLNTKSVLCERTNVIPALVAQAFLYMLNLLDYIPDDCGKFWETIWTPIGFLKSIAKEAITLLIIYLDLQTKLSRVKKTIRNHVINKFPLYRNMIKYSLNEITRDKKKWLQIVEAIKDNDSSINLSNYPNENDANRIKSYSKAFDLGDDIDEHLEDYLISFARIEHNWKFIGNLLDYIVIKTCIFEDTPEDSLICTRVKELKEYDCKVNNVDKDVTEYLDKIEERLDLKNTNKTYTNLQLNVQPSKFSGIKELTYKLSKPHYLTKTERQCLTNTLQSISTKPEETPAARLHMLENIEKNIAISKTSYRTFVASEQLDEKTQKILLNLVKGNKRDPSILDCLNNRISILKDVMKNLTVNQLVLRYKLDKTFRMLLELLLFDIFDILEGNKKNTEMVKKSSKLLMEINLRNILTHGSPLLEVVGDVLDSNDVPTELVVKAVEFITDQPAIEALRALRDSGYFSPKNNPVSADQQAWMMKIKESPRWKDYILLVPEHKQQMYVRSKATTDTTIEFMKAVQEKDYLLIQQSIDEGVNVDFVDVNGKAAIHYAAMEGDMHIMTILVSNGADINIRNADNNLTALHYSAMYNFKDVVEFLLQEKADCFALDNKGRTPVHLANLGNFLYISKVLLREMRKCEIML